MDIAEQRYPQVLSHILAYARLVDTSGDADMQGYASLEKQLEALVQKDMKAYNLAEWWEEEGAEVLAFRIALPDPPRLSQVLAPTAVEDILQRLDAVYVPSTANAVSGFFGAFSIYLADWYHQLLRQNAPHYAIEWFHRQQDSGGAWFEYTLQEKQALLCTGVLDSL